jgi:anti-sigma B factor antagonist
MAITPARTLGLTLYHPSAGVCVVAVNGELDMLTAPLLGTCVRQQRATTPAHLILDLQPLRFLGVSGLTYLLYVRELAQQPPQFRLHLTGLTNRAVARPLELTGVLKLFNTYPTLADGLAALTNGAHPVRRAGAPADHQQER